MLTPQPPLGFGWVGVLCVLSQLCTTQLPAMKSFINPYSAIILGAATGLAIVSTLGVHAVTAKLEHAAAMQCRTQDWPAAKHAAMTEWCREFEATRAIFHRY